MVSIIIPVYNRHEMTLDCLSAIMDTTMGAEVILVDNGSNPPIAKFGTGIIDAKVIRNEANMGFPVAVNQGIEAAQGDIIILLNNDTIVTPKWTERLIRHLGMIDVTAFGDKFHNHVPSDGKYSIVSPMTNYCAWLQRVQVPTYNSKEELFTVANDHYEKHKGQSQDVHFVIGFCMAFRKSLWEELGAFDESLWPCSGEEIDFCFRAIQAGHRVGIAKDVYIHHFGSQTFSDMQREGQLVYNEICSRNDEHLEKKWGVGFWHQQERGQNES